jgi:hyperosmotically inducible protein
MLNNTTELFRTTNKKGNKMKPKSIFPISAVAASLLALPVFAADLPRGKDQPQPSFDRTVLGTRSIHPEKLGLVSKASEIIGMEIRNVQDEKLGKVEDLAVDIAAGRIVQVIVSSGGVLGVGNATLAVPPGAFTLSAPDDKSLRTTVTKEKLKAAPAFKMSKWQDYWETNSLAESYRYYGQEPYFAGSYPLLKGARLPSTHLGYVEKASKLIGLAVRNPQEEKIGKVDNLMVDLEAGRIVEVVVSSGGFLGVGDALSAVPPSAFHYDAAQSVLHLDTTKEALSKAPHFKSSEWPNLGDPAYATRVYRSYRVEPYFATDADNTARNVRDRESGQLTPLDQGSSPADLEASRLIRKSIIDQKGLSVNARNVKIITINGRVTLRGPVNTEEEKRAIEVIAKRVSSNVDNQLEVKREPKTN